jgi:hypothetical protein
MSPFRWHAKRVKLVINTDAHRTQELEYMRYGVDQARLVRGQGCRQHVSPGRVRDTAREVTSSVSRIGAFNQL